MTHPVAIMGLGIEGRRMLVNASQPPAFELSGVSSPSPESVAKTRDPWPEAPFAAGAAAAQAGAAVLDLASPPGPRKTEAVPTAAAGQGFFMEKPLAGRHTQNRGLVDPLSRARWPSVLKFTQAVSRGCEELHRSIKAGSHALKAVACRGAELVQEANGSASP